MSKSNVKPVALAVCAAIGGLALSATAFASQELASGYMAAATAGHGDKAKEEGKCGEGKCGMDKADTDKDGKVSQAEFTAAHPEKKAADFATMDANSDGFIDADEHKAKMEGKCGGEKGEKKAGEGKCGEGKCGGAA
jgi:uncharacterized low-complexity protein